MGDVVELNIKPKSLNKQYQGNKYTVTYKPSTKTWSWCCEITQVIVMRGECDTQVKAVREAEREIGKMLKVQGKAVG